MTPPAEPSERRALVSTIGWSALATLTTVGSRFVASVIIARLLGPENTGKLLYLLWVADFTAVVAMLALPHVVTRFWAELEGQNQPLQAVAVSGWLFRRYIVLAAAGSLVAAWIAFHETGGFESRFVSICFGAYFFSLAMQNYYVSYLAGRQQFRASTRLSLLSSLALVVVVIGAVPVWGIAGAALGYLASSLPGAWLSVRTFRNMGAGTEVPRPLRTRVVSYALFTWISAIVSAVTWSRGEIFFIERYTGDFWVAMFAIGISLSALAAQGPMLLTGALLPHFAQLAGAGRLDTLRGRYATGTRVLSLMLFPLCLGLASLLPVLLPFVYGSPFAASVPAATVLVAFSSLAFTNVGSDVLYALERAWFLAAAGLVGAVAAVLAGVLVIPYAGVWGAVWSRVAIQSAMVAAGAIYLWKCDGFRFPGGDLGRILVAGLACAGCSRAIVWMFPHVLAIGAAIPAGAIVYVAVIRWLRVIKPQDLTLLTEVMERLPASVRSVALTLVDLLTGEPLHPRREPGPRPHPARS